MLPELLYARVVEADERMSRRRRRRARARRGGARAPISRAAFAAGLRSVAIVFMHGWRYTAHELAAERIARAVGFAQVSVSHRVSPLMKLVGRGDTTVVDAYLSPILRRYVDEVAAEMPGVELYFMQSSGGLAEAHAFQGKDAILSGPAGGIVGMVRTAELGLGEGDAQAAPGHRLRHGRHVDRRQPLRRRVRARLRDARGRRARARADDGDPHRRRRRRLDPRLRRRALSRRPAERRRESRAGVLPARRPAHRDRRQRRGRQDPAGVLPARVRPARRRAARRRRRRRALRRARRRDRATRPARRARPKQVAEGFIDIAVGSMANAIKKISVARGYDVTRYTLQCFGGAGGQHACRVADALGMARVFVHPLAGVLSAYGMGLADQTVMRQAALERAARRGRGRRHRRHASTRSPPMPPASSSARASRAARIAVHRRVHLRYEGTDSALVVPFGDERGAAARRSRRRIGSASPS